MGDLYMSEGVRLREKGKRSQSQTRRRKQKRRVPRRGAGRNQAHCTRDAATTEARSKKKGRGRCIPDRKADEHHVEKWDRSRRVRIQPRSVRQAPRGNRNRDAR